MTSLLLPGDLIPENTEDVERFIIKKSPAPSTTILSKIKDGKFVPLRGAIVPKVNDIVVGRVIRARRKELHLVILMVNDVSVKSSLLAELRSVDIQEHDVDNVIASNFAKPGNLVKAQVVALGRSGFYAQLSTAKEGLGVVKIEPK
jgi:exosome complex component CSL4